jgi:hypothetical protein
MAVRSRWLFILLGNNNTGKTSVQRNLVRLLNRRAYKKLPSNKLYDIGHPAFARKARSVFVAGRSYQEFSVYNSVADYFQKVFDPSSGTADLAFMSSHLNIQDVDKMIELAHRRFYNVCGLFFSNSVRSARSANKAIAVLGWNELLLIENSYSINPKKQKAQLELIAETIVQMLIGRQAAS